MLCRECRRQLPRGEDACTRCGAARYGAAPRPRYALVLPDGTRALIHDVLTVGRAAGNQLRIDDPAVSRRHVRLVDTQGAIEVHELGSRFGTFLDGRRVLAAAQARDGQRLRLGDTYLRLERERDADRDGRTIVVPFGETVHVAASAGGTAIAERAPVLPPRPRLRSGWMLKRLDATEGPRRHVLLSLRGQRGLSFTDREAEVIARLDGRLTAGELIADAERRHGPVGLRELLAVLAELSDSGLLAGASESPAGRPGRLRRILRVRTRPIGPLPGLIDRLYRAGGFVLFTRAALVGQAVTILLGAAAFAGVLSGTGARPFRVADHVGLGAAAFIAGRLAAVAVHELAHALTLASLGRRARAVGVKLVVVVPYAYVDTTEAWLEPRRRRIAVSAAGPFADLLVGGAASLVALAAAGPARDIAFQLALGSYAAALLNANPMLERDGYHVLVDCLREPDLRRRARAQLLTCMSGRPSAVREPRSVRLYGVAGVAWSLLTAAFVVTVALGAGARLERVPAVPLAVLAGAVALTPTLAMVWLSVRDRRARRRGARTPATGPAESAERPLQAR